MMAIPEFRGVHSTAISLGKPSERKGTLLQLTRLEGIEDV